jgi:hypothetical protein
MMIYKYTSRPARYGAILAHTLSEYLHNVNVDLSGVEDSLADQVAALSTKVDALQARLEAYDESIDESAPKPKAKAKRKTRAKK